MDDGHKPMMGILPLMLELYDRSAPELKPRQAEFVGQIAAALGDDTEVASADVCNTRQQVEAAVRDFEARDCDGIIVIHLSYAPSLISASALTRCSLPLLLLNTTPAASMGADLVREDIMRNHGIHGVQDLANILLRAGKAYHIVSGHMSDPSVAEDTLRWCRAAMTAGFLRRVRVGRIGDPFEGMGDFSVDLTALQTVVGPQVVLVPPREVAELAQEVPAEQVEAEVEADRERFAPVPGLDAKLHATSVRAGLGLAAAVEKHELDAISMHFMAFNDVPAIGAVPFLGISKLQAQGIGYAGEGDVACASLVAAMARCFGQAGFTEMFCPDWEGNHVFMAHMGECNPNLAAERPVLKSAPFPYGELQEPVVAVGGMAPGPATLANLVCIGEGDFRLTVAEVEVADFPVLDITMSHFKIRPGMPLGDFLTLYSEAGGSHHLAIVPGHVAEDVMTLAELSGLECAVI
ncbi:MAG: hypothetical protein PVH68_15345 [Armatimonadota bacterium]